MIVQSDHFVVGGGGGFYRRCMEFHRIRYSSKYIFLSFKTKKPRTYNMANIKIEFLTFENVKLYLFLHEIIL